MRPPGGTTPRPLIVGATEPAGMRAPDAERIVRDRRLKR
ncbi:hypothetical protein HNP84_010355 [Thermocatellispora tengchongensis]|uniref:Uncharacterized protein n=1 Tax=Thermocatellispora tengchongensis TaxID=1073253 RepID=A0A840PNZ5_9ACTN|nr:hypothetical protein [Thermocatellispora tengchongensis]